jgi:Ca-activated chloride channel family protein
LDEAAIGLAGKETALGDAIGLAIKRLRDQPVENRVLILLTDGANTAGGLDPLKAADLAAKEQLRIYTIGVGNDELLVRTPFGLQRLATGSDLDETTLKAIADKTGGHYFRARDIHGLQTIYQQLDTLEPRAQDETFRPVDELYQWPLCIALLISFGTALAAAGWVSHSSKLREIYHAE